MPSAVSRQPQRQRQPQPQPLTRRRARSCTRRRPEPWPWARALNPLALAAALMALCAMPAHALDKTWRFIGGCAPATADWQGMLSGANAQGFVSCWGLNNTGLSGLPAPNASDNVFITGDGLGTTQTLNFAAASRPAFTGSAATLGIFGLNATSVAALDVQRHTLNVTNLNVGLAAPAALRGRVNQSGGSVNVIGTLALQAGDYNLSGGVLNATTARVTTLAADSQFNMTGGSATLGSLSLGSTAAFNASFNQLAGTLSSGDIVLGAAVGSGLSSLRVAGNAVAPSASWNAASSRLDVGSLGAGRLDIQTGGSLSVFDANVGVLPGAAGRVVVSGLGPTTASTLNVGQVLSVGGFEAGSVLVSTGGVLNAGSVQLNRAPDLFGGELGPALEVAGTGSQANVTLDLRLGTTSRSAMRVADNATLAARDIVVGSAALGRSNVLLENGGQVTARRELVVGDNASARVDVFSGSTLTSAQGTVGVQSLTSGLVRVSGSGSSWLNTGSLTVGFGGQGDVTLEAGARLQVGLSTFLGSGSEGIGSIVATGAGTTWVQSAGPLQIGERGRGRIEIADGATLSTVSTTLGSTSIGIGEAVIRGADTLWLNAGSLTVGRRGTGTLSIQAGAVLSSGASQISQDSVSTGVVNVAGAGSRWSVTGLSLSQGGGSSSLNLSDGGQVVATGAFAAADAGGSARVQVAGAGSLLQTGTLLLGSGGSAELTVGSGGSVRSADGRLGTGAGGSGSASLLGTGSNWTMAGDLVVGAAGQGRLSIEAGALVQAGGTVSAGSQGHIVLDGGTLRASSLLLPDFNALEWRRGELNITGAGGFALDGQQHPPMLLLTSGRTLRVDQTFTLTPSSVLLLNGGNLIAGTLQLNNAVLASQGLAPVLDLGGIGLLTGTGQVTAPVAGGAGLGNRIAPTGSMTLGLADRNNGFSFGGWLDVGNQQVVLLDRDWADLGHTTTLANGGQLVSVNGARQGVGEQFRSNGAASVQGRFLNNGEVVVESGQLSFFDDVSGAGSYAGNVRFLAGFAPGNSTAAVSFGGGDVNFGPHSVLTLEIDGAGFDRLLNINQLSFNGRVLLDFAGSFAGLPGTTLQLLGFNSFSGVLDASRVDVAGFDRELLDLSRLGVDGSIAVVPEPGTWALMLGGLLGLGWWARAAKATRLR
jgi:autotransporter family porin